MKEITITLNEAERKVIGEWFAVSYRESYADPNFAEDRALLEKLYLNSEGDPI